MTNSETGVPRGDVKLACSRDVFGPVLARLLARFPLDAALGPGLKRPGIPGISLLRIGSIPESGQNVKNVVLKARRRGLADWFILE